MTEKELEEKIVEAMKSLKADNVKKHCKDSYKDYEDELKNEIVRKQGVDEWKDIPEDERERLLEKETDRHPLESYLYVMFSDEGDLDGWTIENNQYFRGHAGPTSAILYGPDGIDYDDVRREIGNDLFTAIETE